MNAPRAWSDEEVHAFVDGEMDAQAAARFAAQVQQDLALAERVARQRTLRRQLAAAFEPVLREPVPERLAQAAAASVTSLDAARRAGGARPRPAPLWWAAAAASVLLAVFIGWRLPHPVDAPLWSGAQGLMAGGALERALSERISATGSKDEGVLVSLSFRASDGRYCRTFSLDAGIDGLACRSASGWQFEAPGRSPAADDAEQTYRQASSQLSPSVIAALSRWQAGDALTPEEERQVRDAGWR